MKFISWNIDSLNAALTSDGSLTVTNLKKYQKAYNSFIFLSIFLFLYCVQFRTMI